jgi:hypothetical protein
MTSNGLPVNPLVPGGIGPYADHTQPVVDSITIRRSVPGPEVFTNFVRGRVVFVAAAHDTPTIRVTGVWGGLPVTPALLAWRMQRLNGSVVVPRRVAWDVRASQPSSEDFWRFYARGTFQNMAVFGSHYSYGIGGVYLFKLTQRPFDTRSLRDGVYDLVVTASDTRGNHGSRSLRFLVHNRRGWVGSGL